MTISSFLDQLQQMPNTVSFQDTISVIDGNFDFSPTAFKNGNHYNKAGENNGSCKIFAFAKLLNLSKEATLACFGPYYFDEVLNNPEDSNHQNIRNFMQTGWDGIQFEGEALVLKNSGHTF